MFSESNVSKLAKLAWFRKPPVLWLAIIIGVVRLTLDLLRLSGLEVPVSIPHPIGFVMLVILATLFVSSVALQWLGDIAFRILKRKDSPIAEIEHL